MMKTPSLLPSVTTVLQLLTCLPCLRAEPRGGRGRVAAWQRGYSTFQTLTKDDVPEEALLRPESFETGFGMAVAISGRWLAVVEGNVLSDSRVHLFSFEFARGRGMAAWVWKQSVDSSGTAVHLHRESLLVGDALGFGLREFRFDGGEWIEGDRVIDPLVDPVYPPAIVIRGQGDRIVMAEATMFGLWVAPPFLADSVKLLDFDRRAGWQVEDLALVNVDEFSRLTGFDRYRDQVAVAWDGEAEVAQVYRKAYGSWVLSDSLEGPGPAPFGPFVSRQVAIGPRGLYLLENMTDLLGNGAGSVLSLHWTTGRWNRRGDLPGVFSLSLGSNATQVSLQGSLVGLHGASIDVLGNPIPEEFQLFNRFLRPVQVEPGQAEQFQGDGRWLVTTDVVIGPLGSPVGGSVHILAR